MTTTDDGVPPRAEDPVPPSVADAEQVSALDERGQPPTELGGGGLRRELEGMYAAIAADAVARLRWLER